MKNNATELVFILDRSGSMGGFEADTIGGFNATVEKQKKQEGSVYVSTVLFDNESSVIHDRVDIDKIKPMTESDYHPNYEIWANKGKYRLKTANISRFWLIFFDFENILRNNYAPFGCNYAPDWCIFFAPCHHKNRGNKRAEF